MLHHITTQCSRAQCLAEHRVRDLHDGNNLRPHRLVAMPTQQQRCNGAATTAYTVDFKDNCEMHSVVSSRAKGQPPCPVQQMY